MTNNFVQLTIATLLTFPLSACDGPFSSHSNYDLSDAYNKCDFNKLTAAGAQRCINIKKECDKRKSENGFRC